MNENKKKQGTFMDWFNKLKNLFSSKHVDKKELQELLNNTKMRSAEMGMDFRLTQGENNKLSDQEKIDYNNEITKWDNRTKRADALTKVLAENEKNLPLSNNTKSVIDGLKDIDKKLESIMDPRKEGTTDNVQKFDEETLGKIEIYCNALDAGFSHLEKLLGIQQTQTTKISSTPKKDNTSQKAPNTSNNKLSTPNYSDISKKETSKTKKGMSQG